MSSFRVEKYDLGGVFVRYLHYKEGGVTFELLPADHAPVAERREVLSGTAVDHVNWVPHAESSSDRLMQIKLVGAPTQDAFSGGITMFDSFSARELQFESRETVVSGGVKDIQTVLVHPAGLRCIHHVVCRDDESVVEVFSEVVNESQDAVELELLSSFVLSGITPFDAADAPGRIKLHRFRSWWSAEGRLESRTLEDMHLERPWITHGVRAERFGQVGSMPVRKFFPFVAAEDVEAGVVWGAKLAWAGSWQMEAIRRGDRLTLTGGHADREFGHWKKTLASGETLVSPTAMLSCLEGSLDDLCDCFVKAEEARIIDLGDEPSMPIIFNEWCSSWGVPSSKNVMEAAERIKGLPVKYFVIDVGWVENSMQDCFSSNGDWIVDQSRFPGGLKPVADALNKQGLIPGIWFEFEVCSPNSAAWNLTEHHLQRDGRVLQAGSRRFWNLCDPWVQDYLSKKLIDQLRDNGFGYLKVDYNDAIGIGCDHPDSLGEGLRQHILAVQEFFRKIHRELPDLIIENCSSGGHRLEPSMMRLTSMSSFSDAHESEEIPIIAANMQRLIPPRQSQIWAVLRKEDSLQRLTYSLAAGCLGRLCISGDISTLSDEQMLVVKAGLEFYEAAAPVIRDGISDFIENSLPSRNHPEGWQAVIRYSPERHEVLVVAHFFHNPPETVEIDLGTDNWKVGKRFASGGEAECLGGTLCLKSSGAFSVQALLLSSY